MQTITKQGLGPWAPKRRLPPVIPPEARPPESLLGALRGRVEGGCPFDLARRWCGVSDATHTAWMERGLAQHDAQPDRVYHDGSPSCVVGGSLEPEAEYVRIATTVQAGAAGELCAQLWAVAKTPGRKRDQLTAIEMLLRAYGERAFDPRTEQDVTVRADASDAVDQAAIDALTTDERKALTAAARANAQQIAATEAALAQARERTAAAADSPRPDAPSP